MIGLPHPSRRIGGLNTYRAGGPVWICWNCSALPMVPTVGDVDSGQRRNELAGSCPIAVRLAGIDIIRAITIWVRMIAGSLNRVSWVPGANVSSEMLPFMLASTGAATGVGTGGVGVPAGTLFGVLFGSGGN